MHGLVSLLDENHYVKIEQIWKNLEEKTNLKGIKITPYPHFSWQVAENYNFNLLEEKMIEAAKIIPPFTIRTSGIGIFTGKLPVIYVKIVNNISLNKIHFQINEIFKPISISPLKYYELNFWVPHISLAYGDVNENNICDAIKLLAFQDFNWEINIENLAFIYEPTGEIGKLKYRCELKGK